MKAGSFASIISLLLLVSLLAASLIACRSVSPASPASNKDIPFSYEDADDYYTNPIPPDNDQDWYNNYYNLEF